MQAEPRATYRLQMRPEFGFRAAAALVPYLAQLGISHLYCSPIWQATPGSTHGYDVVNPAKLNAELGGEADYNELLVALRAHDMRLLLDIVPNHMAIAPQNPWWQDVLEHGAASRHARFFDVDWNGSNGHSPNQVLLPVLGNHYGRVLEAGELRLQHRGARLRLRYFEHDFPIDPATQGELLHASAERCRSERLAYLGDAYRHLREAREPEIRERHLHVLDAMLNELCRRDEVVAAIEAEVDRLNQDVDALDALIQRQSYRLAFWRMAGQELGYRRFFDIHTLAGLRVEDARVFEAVHRLPFKLFESETLEGLRVDHPDGLRDPAQYFSRLRDALPRAWLLAEKILMPGERLPPDWPIAGTTGYEFLNLVGGLFVDAAGLEEIDSFYREFTGIDPFENIVLESKRMVGSEILGSELNRLAALLNDICQRHRRYRDYTLQELRDGLNELAANFPVYRSYVRGSNGRLADTDREHVALAVERAIGKRADLDVELFRFIGNILMLHLHGEPETELVMRFQQFSAPAMAKGLEDTALYRFCRLISCNDVGADPGHFTVSPASFHHACEARQQEHPLALLATDTHDTKFSADVRARLAVLSEMPTQWIEAVRCWDLRLKPYCQGGFPEANTRYLFYQALLGAWPIDETRMLGFMEKAAREMKQYTSWLRQDAAYEHALRSFVKTAMDDHEFLEDIRNLVARLVEPGHRNSLAQVLLKLAAPGVPDIYQGTESWAYSLVDPDNRREVGFERLRDMLDRLDGDISPEQVNVHSHDGLPKLWVTHSVLKLRCRRPNAFDSTAAYNALSVQGKHGAFLLAFLRGDAVAAVVPRRALIDDWADTTVNLPEGRWHNLLTDEQLDGGRVLASDLLARFPVALLERGGE